MEIKDITKEYIEAVVDFCKEYKGFRFISYLHAQDPYDKTTVFDFIDNDWFDYVFSNIEKVAKSDLYKGDGTIEYRIAYICVEINLLHKLPNGNKRTSILVLWILLFLNFNIEDKILKIKENDLYNIAKKIASEGTINREQNIQYLKEYITKL